MMVIVGVIKQTGVFDFLAIWAAKRSKGKPFRLMVMLMVITGGGIAGARQRHDHHARRTGDTGHLRPAAISAQPFLIAEVLASNIGGAATLIGDPPNIIIGSRAGLTFNDFLVNMAPRGGGHLRAVGAVHQGAVPKGSARNHMRLDNVMALQERRAIKDTRLLVRSMVGAGAGDRRIQPALRAACGAVHRRAARCRHHAVGHQRRCRRGAPRSGVADAGVLHGAVRHGRRTGAHRSDRMARRLPRSTLFGDDFFLAATGLLFGSAVLGAFVDNILTPRR